MQKILKHGALGVVLFYLLCPFPGLEEAGLLGHWRSWMCSCLKMRPGLNASTLLTLFFCFLIGLQTTERWSSLHSCSSSSVQRHPSILNTSLRGTQVWQAVFVTYSLISDPEHVLDSWMEWKRVVLLLCWLFGWNSRNDGYVECSTSCIRYIIKLTAEKKPCLWFS